MRGVQIFVCIALLCISASYTEATDRFYSDNEAKSPSGRYIVTARSPDNQPGGKRKAFQGSFTYTCKDTQSGKTIWTRQQAMGEPQQWGDDPDNTYTPQEEGSPCSLYVSDSGRTVIYTGWQELIIVGIDGKDTGKLDILEDCLTKKENKLYVSETTAGPMWAGRSHWYFVTADSREYFVIRPWWGRHVIVDLATSALKTPTKRIAEATAKAEQEYVLSVLKSLLDGTLEKCDGCGGYHEAVFAGYLAGELKVHKAIPALRKLESSTHSGSCTVGGFSDVPEGRVDPFNYCTYTTRQSVHLALRRLGEKPGAFPCTSFKTEHRDYDQQKPYVRKPVPGTRDSNAGKIKKGMTPEQVLDLIDCPDYIPAREWQYDIDAENPYTLTVSWTDERTVEDVNVVRPALWQEGTIRDREW